MGNKSSCPAGERFICVMGAGCHCQKFDENSLQDPEVRSLAISQLEKCKKDKANDRLIIIGLGILLVVLLALKR